jgi:hypothetical protein
MTIERITGDEPIQAKYTIDLSPWIKTVNEASARALLRALLASGSTMAASVATDVADWISKGFCGQETRPSKWLVSIEITYDRSYRSKSGDWKVQDGESICEFFSDVLRIIAGTVHIYASPSVALVYDQANSSVNTGWVAHGAVEA